MLVVLEGSYYSVYELYISHNDREAQTLCSQHPLESIDPRKPLNLEFTLYTKDCDISVREWGGTSSGTVSFFVGGTHFGQAHVGGLLHLLPFKHIRPELLDDVWCRKNSKFNYNTNNNANKPRKLQLNSCLPNKLPLTFLTAGNEELQVKSDI